LFTFEIILHRKKEREKEGGWKEMSDSEENVKANGSEQSTGQVSIEREREGRKEGEEGRRHEGEKEGRK